MTDVPSVGVVVPATRVAVTTTVPPRLTVAAHSTGPAGSPGAPGAPGPPGPPARALVADLASTAALPAWTYAGGVMTATAPGQIPYASFDQWTPYLGDRVLVRNETSAKRIQHGIYVVTDQGSASRPWILTHAPDASSTESMAAGTTVWVAGGTTLANALFVQTVTTFDFDVNAGLWQIVSTFYSDGIVQVYHGGTGIGQAYNARSPSYLGKVRLNPVTPVKVVGIPVMLYAVLTAPTVAGSPYRLTHNLGAGVPGYGLGVVQAWEIVGSAYQQRTVQAVQPDLNTLEVTVDRDYVNNVLVSMIGYTN